LVSAAFFLVGTLASSAATLIDVAFTDHTTGKVGFAATGVTAADFWNTYLENSGALPNLEFVDGTVSGAGLTVANAGGGNGNGASDPMYGGYLYPSPPGGNITVTVTNLMAGTYDFYLYGHGDQANQNSVFQLTVGAQSYGSQATLNGSGWNSSVWQEGVQYVEFTGVSVAAGQTITILVEPGATQYAPLCGLQMASVGPPSPNAFIVTQPANQTVFQGSTATFSVVAGGTAPLAYQWLFDNGNISAGTNSSYSVTNAQPSDAGSYSVIVTNAYGSVTSAVATLNVNTSAATLIDVAFTDHTTGKVGFAATGVTAADFWNTYLENSGALPNLEFVDGTVSGAGLTVANAGGGNGNGASDPMYGGYLYPSPPGGNITVTVTNLMAGTYDFYLYGHGDQANQNSVFQLTVGAQSYGSQATLNGSGWNSSVWQEGVQYVEFTGVSVAAGQTITILVEPGATQYAPLCGLQMALFFVPTNGLPVVIGSPASQTVNSGSQVSFAALAGGSPSTIQWYFGTEAVSGGNSSPLVLTANDGSAGSYSAVFSNSYGMTTTAVAVLTVIDPPVIATSPVSQATNAGASVTFSASASGSPATVQWYRINSSGSNAVSGATSTTLTVTASSATAGSYVAVFKNSAGTATSGSAVLSLIFVPFANGGFELINNHSALTANAATTISVGSTWLNNWSIGGSTGYTRVANGSYVGFTPYEGHQFIVFAAGAGSISQTFNTIPGVQYALSLAAGKYGSAGAVSLTATTRASDNTLLSSNRFAPASSAWTSYPFAFTASTTNTTLVLADTSTGTFTLDLMLDDVALTSAPVILTSPVSQTVTSGTSVTFTASASGSPATVQWFQGTNAISLATNATLTFVAGAASPGTYTAVFSNAAGSATTTGAVLNVQIPVFLTQQPQSLTTNVGATVTFAGAAGGDSPITFQWQFNGATISGATDASLVLTNAQMTNAGSYALMVTNAYGWAASTNAVLSFASTLQVASASVVGAGTVTVPVNLLATGNESVMRFSLNFDTNVLTFMDLTIGSGALGASITSNANLANSGQIGVLEGYVYGGAFSPGTQDLVDVTFAAALVTNSVTTTISFGDSPVSRQIFDPGLNPIVGTYLAGTVTVTPTSLEGDVSPRPNGDYAVGANDWAQEARFVVGLDTVSNISEFQRADCAPRGTSGDGVINAADLAQVGRYAVGLDPITPMGGPTSPPPSGGNVVKSKAPQPPQPYGKSDLGSRTISLVPITQGAATNSVMVQLQAQGGENTVVFSLAFDPTALSFVSATPAAGPAWGMYLPNTNGVATGKLGIALALQPGQSFAAGAQQIVKLNFSSVCYSNTASLAFSDMPAPRSVADVSTALVSASYLNGTLQVGGEAWPQLAISQSAGGITLSWPVAATALAPQMTTDLNAAWTAAGGTPTTNGGTVFLTLPVPSSPTFFRLYHP
jgi:hypothetical protein